ncbi:hypothetical protein J2Z50_005984 [Ensifer mexicanus]|nr:hypothetical protein [Sinorhizobium mexicanum]
MAKIEGSHSGDVLQGSDDTDYIGIFPAGTRSMPGAATTLSTAVTDGIS